MARIPAKAKHFVSGRHSKVDDQQHRSQVQHSYVDWLNLVLGCPHFVMVKAGAEEGIQVQQMMTGEQYPYCFWSATSW